MARRRKIGRRITLLVLVIIVAVAAWLWLRPESEQQPTPAEKPIADSSQSGAKPILPADEDRDGRKPEERTAPKAAPAAPGRLSADQAKAAYERGMAALKNNSLVEARKGLSAAYFSERLGPQRRDEVRQTLTDLADITLIGQRSTVYPGDPYAFYYEFKPGETYIGVKGVERTQKLHVPWLAVKRINSLQRAADIQAGRPYKFIYGPFHAIVYKSDFVMDIYLQREGLERIFVKRLRVGMGRNGSTPAGMWRVRLGGKNSQATWYPPPNSELRGPVAYGDENYAFGTKGLWIGLEGLDQTNRLLSNYGIHSTSDQSSIGRAESLGCIRLADGDIDLVYSLLYEHWSTVEVRP